MNQHSYDGTDDNLTSLPEDEIMSMYGRMTQLVGSAKAFLTKVVAWYCMVQTKWQVGGIVRDFIEIEIQLIHAVQFQF